MRKRILAASPVQQQPDILQHFLDTIAELNHKEVEIDYLFIDDNVSASSSEMLAAFQSRAMHVTILRHSSSDAYHKDENTHYWNESLVDKVAAMKDQIISYALTSGYDALFLIDSDLLIHPDTVMRLLDTKKEIISNIFWTKWQKNANELPQVWVMDEYDFVRHYTKQSLSSEEKAIASQAFLEQLREPGIYEVGGLGACTLISRNAMEKGVRFQRLPNLSFWGEDRHFCIRAAALGFQLYVDTRMPAYHIYREADLEGVERYKRLIGGVSEPSISVSLCMIVRNEEESIGRCLDSVQGLVDEIIIVDTGSTDRTKDIVRPYTDLIFDFEWIEDFAAARNYAFSKATKDYILWLDADDIIREEDRLKFMSLKGELNPKVDSVMMHYNLSYDLEGRPTVSMKRNRLVKRSRQFKWIGAVHEYLEVSGQIIHQNIAVSHQKNKAHTDRNLRIYRKRVEKGEAFSPRDLYYFANELKDHAYYEEAVERYEQFLATKQGWMEDNIAACVKSADCYGHLYEHDLQYIALLRTFIYDRPRAEACCKLGARFLEDQRIQQAIYWFETATKLDGQPQSGTLVDSSYWTWLPYLQLCVCYDKLGQTAKAYECNEKALQYQPKHASMLYNKKYLEEQLAKQQEASSLASS